MDVDKSSGTVYEIEFSCGAPVTCTSNIPLSFVITKRQICTADEPYLRTVQVIVAAEVATILAHQRPKFMCSTRANAVMWVPPEASTSDTCINVMPMCRRCTLPKTNTQNPRLFVSGGKLGVNCPVVPLYPASCVPTVRQRTANSEVVRVCCRTSTKPLCGRPRRLATPLCSGLRKPSHSGLSLPSSSWLVY
jgi:hypothetical protein